MAACDSIEGSLEPLLIRLGDLSATKRFGKKLGSIAQPGDVVFLIGGLGAGKTTLTQSIALGLEVPANMYVTSPSFALLHEYHGRIPLFHMDCYRLSGEEDIEGAGLVEFIGCNGLTVIEWPDRLGDLTPSERLEIEIIQSNGNKRKLRILAFGTAWQKRLTFLEND